MIDGRKFKLIAGNEKTVLLRAKVFCIVKGTINLRGISIIV